MAIQNAKRPIFVPLAAILKNAKLNDTVPILETNRILKNAYKQADLENVDAMINYLELISGKELETSFIRQNLFKTRWKQSEIKKIARCHVKASILYLKHLLSTKEINALTREIQMTIAELVDYVKKLDLNQDTSFIVVSTNELPSSAHYLNATELFYNHNIREDYQNNYDCDVLVLYALRLTLEKRIYSTAGIDRILNKNNKPIPLSKMIDFIQGLKNIEFSANIKWDEIKHVNKWLNHFMHRNLRPHPWIIHQAIETLNNILNGKPYKSNNRVYHSRYSATVVKDVKKLDDEIKSKINDEFPNSRITWLHNRELLITK
ncbi:hypothetical protein ACT3CE_03410 [Marinifilum sp. RC60d5]|uniref:hypothetical protein n=1 Tax=Marinifilum sp. RC60d5 TaxID=3458414 RepID=UPI0040366535